MKDLSSEECRTVQHRGFTLIELLIVIAIVAILVGMLVPAVQSALCSGREATAQSTIKNLETALKNYANDYGVYPEDNAQGDSQPLTRHLSKKKARGIVYYEFKDSQIEEDGSEERYYSPFGKTREEFEYHYTVPTGDLYTSNFSESFPSKSKRNKHSPSLWTAGCNFQPSSPSEESQYEVNNFE